MRTVGRQTEVPGDVVIISGPAAAGKTSVAELLAERSPEPSVHLRGDDFFRALKTGRRRGWEAGASPQHEVVFEAMGAAGGAYAAGGYFVIVDTLVRPRFFSILVGAIRPHPVTVHLVVLRPSFGSVVRRSHLRDPASRHTDEVLRWLFGQFGHLADEVSVIDNTDQQPLETALALEQLLRSGAARVSRSSSATKATGRRL